MKIYVIIACFFWGLMSLEAQSPPSTCPHLSMLGPHYQGEYGTWDDVQKQPVIKSYNTGLHSSRHKTRYNFEGNLSLPNPNIPPYEAIPATPPGMPTSIQLGNTGDGRQWERLRTTILIGPENTLILVHFAVVLEDDGHAAYKQPKFEFKAIGPDSTPLPCGTYNVIASGNIPGFKSQNKLRFRNWTTAALDLRAYVGQEITVEFTTFDCSEGGHFGMALFAVECLKAEIQPISKYCPGQDTSITLAAPPGFTDYVWNTGHIGQHLSISHPVAGQKYSVMFQPFSSLSSNCTIGMEYEIPSGNDFPDIPTTRYCSGSQVAISAPTLFSGSTFLWENGSTSQTIVVNQPGNYAVTITHDGCPSTANVNVEEVLSPVLEWEYTQAPACHNTTDGKACARLKVPDNNVTFLWNTGQSEPCLDNLASGTFIITAKEPVLGCTDQIAITLPVPPPLSAQLLTLKTPACDNDPVGRIKAKISGGTPPYTTHWSNGSAGEEAEIESRGVYRAFIVDANGCPLESFIQVDELIVLEDHGHNYCHEGMDGWIELSISGGVPPLEIMLAPSGQKNQGRFDGLASGNYVVHVQDSTGCVHYLQIPILEKRTEPLKIDLPDGLTFNLGDQVVLTPSVNFPIKSWLWEADGLSKYCATCSEMNGTAVKSGYLFLHVTDIYGCPDSISRYLMVTKDRPFYAPNSFSPNAENEENRYWRVYPSEKQLAEIQVAYLQIFDRWGNRVFSAQNCFSFTPNARWDGVFKGKQADPGVYTWTIEIQYIDGESILFRGDFALLRP